MCRGRESDAAHGIGTNAHRSRRILESMFVSLILESMFACRSTSSELTSHQVVKPPVSMCCWHEVKPFLHPWFVANHRRCQTE